MSSVRCTSDSRGTMWHMVGSMYVLQATKEGILRSVQRYNEGLRTMGQDQRRVTMSQQDIT
jgi:hypothetical protein